MAGVLPEPEQIEGFINDELMDVIPDDDARDAFMDTHGDDMVSSFRGAVDGSFGDYILEKYTDLFREIYEEVLED